MGAQAVPHLGCYHPLSAFMGFPRPLLASDITPSANLPSFWNSVMGNNLDTVITTLLK